MASSRIVCIREMALVGGCRRRGCNRYASMMRSSSSSSSMIMQAIEAVFELGPRLAEVAGMDSIQDVGKAIAPAIGN